MRFELGGSGANQQTLRSAACMLVVLRRNQMQKVAPEGCQTLKIQIWTLTIWAAQKSQGRPRLPGYPHHLVLGTQCLVLKSWLTSNGNTLFTKALVPYAHVFGCDSALLARHRNTDSNKMEYTFLFYPKFPKGYAFAHYYELQRLQPSTAAPAAPAIRTDQGKSKRIWPWVIKCLFA